MKKLLVVLGAGAALVVLVIVLALVAVLGNKQAPDDPSSNPTGPSPSTEALPTAPSSTTATTRDRPAPPELPPRTVVSTPNARLNQLLAPAGDRGQRVTADIRHTLPRLENEAEVQAVLTALRDHRTSDVVRNECLVLLRKSGHPLTDELIDLLGRDYEEARIRGFFAQHLGGYLADSVGEEKTKLIEALLGYAFEDQDLTVRREALLALFRNQHPQAVSFACDNLDDKACEGMRDLVIRQLHKMDKTDAIPAIRAYAHAQDTVVRVAALNVLGKWRDHASEQAFKDAIADENPRVKRAGQLAYDRMMGEAE